MKRLVISGACLALLVTPALAQTSAVSPTSAAPPPSSAPWGQQADVTGTVKAFTLTPVGEIEGIILTNGTELHVPPHLTEQVVSAVRLGRIRGRSRLERGRAKLFIATAFTGQRGRSVVDQGPPPPGMRPPPPPPGQPAPGAQLGDGTGSDIAGSARPARGFEWSHSRRRDDVRLPPPSAWQMSSLLQPGQVSGCPGLEPVEQLRSRR